MSRNLGKKMNKRVRTENSVQAYACACVAACACVCGIAYGGVMDNFGNKYQSQITTDANTKALN